MKAIVIKGYKDYHHIPLGICCDITDEMVVDNKITYLLKYDGYEQYVYGEDVFLVQDDDHFKVEIRKIEKTLVIYPVSRLIKILEDDGYEARDTFFGKKDFLGFNYSMLQYCGKEPSSKHMWNDEWLETVEIGEEVVVTILGEGIIQNMKNLWINNKNQKLYRMIGYAINCTNDRDGEKVVLYKSVESETLFIREEKEFLQKFRRTKL